jgi:diguanylate cyclase (GGDEF)-like protein/PAS domain S-box-containing protein
MRPAGDFSPFASRGRRAVVAILITFGAFSIVSVALSTSATSRSKDRAAVVQVAGRQRTLAERYVNEVLLVRAGVPADPSAIAAALKSSTDALIAGGAAPAVEGDDDEVEVAPADGTALRSQLEQERRLVNDLTATGRAVVAGENARSVHLTAHERIAERDPVKRLRILSALTSNVSLNAAGNVARSTDRNVDRLVRIEFVLGVAGLIASLLLAWALIAATRRQTAHFRSLVTSSTDLVIVFGKRGCRYVSQSVTRMLGHRDAELLGDELIALVHEEDREALRAAIAGGAPRELVFRVRNRFGEWRHLEAHVTDLREDRYVAGVVLNARDVTERLRLEEQLTVQAFHDNLTGLANRALFQDRVDQALARSARSRAPLAILLVDLDGFKQVNDSLGHSAGDQLLQEVATRFTAVKRAGDTLARLGGDEFALLLEGAGESQAIALAERLLESLVPPVTIPGRVLPIGASVGVVLHPGGAGESEELVRHADLAMYAAKKAGRGRFEVFHFEMARELGETLGLETELRVALDRGQLEVYYQPEVDPQTEAIVGVEALVRWHSPTRGVVMPGVFIPIAEASGLIHPIGDFVLRQACAQAAGWVRDGVVSEGFVTWVNLSGRQLAAGGIAAAVRAALKDTGLAPAHLGLEVTETSMVGEGAAGKRARDELKDLHDDGVRIAVDDFGTGFSSLDHLRQFPVDLIKVDRSFVQGIEHDARDAAITANLASLAHALGLEAIAEGIETDEQLSRVQELGCDLAQGFLFAEPMPATEVTGLLVRNQSRPDQPAVVPARAG